MREPTVYIKTENGVVLKNKSDFDPQTETLCTIDGELIEAPDTSLAPIFEGDGTPDPVDSTEIPPAAPDTSPASDTPLFVGKFVAQIGDKFFITNQTGKKKLVKKAFLTEAEAMQHIASM